MAVTVKKLRDFWLNVVCAHPACRNDLELVHLPRAHPVQLDGSLPHL